jgi:hypothetical protein
LSLRVASFTVRATADQAVRFNRAAQAEGYASTGAWLGAAADAYLKVRARAGLPLPLVWSRGKVRVDLEDGSTVELKGWRSRPFGLYRGDPTGPGLRGRHAFTLVYLPDRRPLATFRYAGHCKALAAELAGPLIRGMPPPNPERIVDRHRREEA